MSVATIRQIKLAGGWQKTLKYNRKTCIQTFKLLEITLKKKKNMQNQITLFYYALIKP